MKKIVFGLLVCAFSHQIFAQCNPDFTITQVGFYPGDSLLACVERGVYYDEVIQFKNFDVIPPSLFPLCPTGLVINEVRIDSVKNLPPGINFSCHNPGCTYGTGENGCVRVRGVTTATPGTYVFEFYATIKASCDTIDYTLAADPLFLAQYGIGYSLTVTDSGVICFNTQHPFYLYANARRNYPICVGDSAQLFTSVSGGYAPYTYSWSPAGALSNPNIANPKVAPFQPGSYHVTVTDAFNYTVTDSVIVDFTPYPNIVVTNDTTVCQGGSVQLSAAGGTAYSWSPAATLSAANIANPLAWPVSPTIYKVEVSNDGCVDSAFVEVTLDTLGPAASFSIVKNNLNVFFNNQSLRASEFIWYFGNGDSSTVDEPQNYLYSAPGVYLATLIAKNDCGETDTFEITIDMLSSIDDLNASSAISVFPNPTNDLIYVGIFEKAQNINCEIYNSLGSKILSKNDLSGNEKFSLDITQQPAGIYFLKIWNNDFSVVKKIKKQ